MTRSRAVGIVAAALVAAAPAARGQGQPGPVQVARVVRQDVARGRTFLGTIEPTRTSTVGSPVEGRVLEYLVDEGQRVETGQPLVRLRSRQLELELEVARSQLRLLREELAELEHGSRPEEIAQAKAELAAVEADVAYRRAQLERARELHRRNATTREELDLAIQGHAKAEAERELARARLALVEEGPRPEKLEQARTRIAIQEDEIARREDLLEEHVASAPFAGYVVAERTEVGQWLAKGAPVVDLVALDEVHVVVGVPEESIRFLGRGAAARIELAAYPDQVFTGSVEIVSPRADPRTRAVPVKIRVENAIDEGAGPRLKIGLTARATLEAGEVEAALLVPKDALVLGGPRPMVYVVDPDPAQPRQGKVRPVPVELGVAHGGRIQAIGALEPGQRVVVMGNERLRPGQAVTMLDPEVE